jgi:hypothetical protein
VLQAAGVSYYPSREWALLLPCYLVVAVLLGYWGYERCVLGMRGCVCVQHNLVCVWHTLLLTTTLCFTPRVTAG